MNWKRPAVLARGRRLLACAVLVSFLSPFTTRAAEALAQYSSRVWQMGDGLPHNEVQAVVQTRDGYLWVGTREGLARFDGVRFQAVELPTKLRHPSIISLKTTRSGSLWIGTAGAGLLCKNGDTFTCYPGPGAATNFYAFEIHEDGDGAIWVGSSLGVLKFQAGKVQRITDFRVLVETLCADNQGRIWMARSRRLECLSDPKVASPVAQPGVLPPEPRRLYCDPAGVFWLAASNGVFEVTQGRAQYYQKAEGPAGFICSFLRDSAGNLWLGSYSGLNTFVKGEYVSVKKPEESWYHIYVIFEDRERNLWLGSEQGLERLSLKPFRTYTTKDGLSLNKIASVCPGQDGSVWIGAWGGGLNRLQDGRITQIRQADGLSSDFILALCEATDGSLWVGTDYSAPLNHLQAGRITQYARSSGFENGATAALLQDSEGALWAGTRDGLYCLRHGGFTRYTTREGLISDRISALCASHDGSMWLGTEGGLMRWRAGKFSPPPAADARLRTKVLCLYEDAQSVLWIGTKGQGLLRLEGDQVRAFSSKEGLYSDSLYAILEDDQHNLWFNSSRGIFRADKRQFESDLNPQAQESLNCISYGPLDGILTTGQYDDPTQYAACKGTDGRLWFRTVQGVATVDPRELRPNELPPPVTIEEVTADEKPQPLPSVGAIAASRPGDPPSGPVITIQPGRGDLRIRYTALSFRAPEKNRFRYRLDGVDSTWVEAGGRHEAYYNNLHPGTYRFQVIACNNDGVWNREGASLETVLLPHFWQTWWFKSSAVALGVALVGGTALYTTRRRMQRQLARLEQQRAIERERARIARDMHDELGAKLTRIFFQGASARHSVHSPEAALQVIQTMSETARGLVASLDEIVWAVDPENDSLEDLVNYISRYATEFFQNSPVTCRLLIAPDLPQRRLQSDVRHNLFLAVKEALHNALKHAQATTVELSITGQTSGFDIVISDNGCGFAPGGTGAPQGLKRTGHGLTNLEQRLASVGGTAEIVSQPGQGTQVKFHVPFPEES